MECKLAGFEGGGDSISNAFSSFEKAHFGRCGDVGKLADEKNSKSEESTFVCVDAKEDDSWWTPHLGT